MSTKEQRKCFRAYHEESTRIFKAWADAGYPRPYPKSPELPADLVGLQCGAKTKRAGTPCKLNSIYLNGRCKYHGGMSTGPKTDLGKKKSSQNAKKARKVVENAAIS
jgi:hypothetical protein